MTRFIYIADTHMGADRNGYQQQSSYPDKVAEIVGALRGYISKEGDIDFVLHGGDLTTGGTDEEILAAVDCFDLPVPVRLCLGNHDLPTPGHLARWLELAPCFFVGGNPDYTITANDCIIHVNHWGSGSEPVLSSTQADRLTRELSSSTHLPHMIVTHSSIYPLPAEQTGLPEPIHIADGSFVADITALVAEHPNVKCVLGAHTHMNMRVTRAGVEFVSVSSLVETPFEFKLFEVTPELVRMVTVSLDKAISFDGEYDKEKTFVQGRSIDRSFSTMVTEDA